MHQCHLCMYGIDSITVGVVHEQKLLFVLQLRISAHKNNKQHMHSFEDRLNFSNTFMEVLIY